MLTMADRICPQFVTHNAHTMAAVIELAKTTDFEFQRLHGMGEIIHNIVRTTHASECRIYAPVGKHSDLLAYLVRRLLENGANSSFVNQIFDLRIKPKIVAQDPLKKILKPKKIIKTGAQIFSPERKKLDRI